MLSAKAAGDKSMDIFKVMKFRYRFRKHQQMMLDKLDRKLRSSRRKVFRFHLVAPPGSGKTIVGLEIARRLDVPTAVICPNITIQGQWADKIRLFLPEYGADALPEEINIGTPTIKPVNIFTYQMLSVPCGDDEALVRTAENRWAEEVSQSQNTGIEEALLRICRMRDSNPRLYKAEISKINKKLRQKYLNEAKCDLSKILHPNTVNLIDGLKRYGIRAVIFDECHHLQNYWALVMKEIVSRVGVKYIIGLTATPPVDEGNEDLLHYTDLFGEIDFQLPTPAVIKDGMLAPFQDLVYFCRPAPAELEYIRNCHKKFRLLADKFNKENSDFFFWIVDRIVKRRLISGETQDWTKFINSRPNFAIAGVKFLLQMKYKIPWDITVTENMYEPMTLDDWICLIEDYALNLLKLSSDEKDINLYAEIRDALRDLGYVLTEKGIRAHSSLMDRVLAYSRSKLEAVKTILKTEMSACGDRIRAAIITDFEISNALSLKKAKNVNDDKCGGAISVMKELVSDDITDELDPVMVTAKSLICDDDLAEEYVRLGLEWAGELSLEIDFSLKPAEFGKFVFVEGSGRDWSSRTAVLFTTYLFEKGVTKCIVGTRGLLSEGWDTLNLNTLIDLSVMTTYASVNQLRGRSIRKSNDDPKKVSNNWDVICVAPDLEKGYNDLKRLYKKHDQFYGICDDGQIQMGVNHIDPMLGEIGHRLDDEDITAINEKMLKAAVNRDKAYEAWKVGEPYDNMELGCCEIKLLKPVSMKDGSLFPDERRTLKSKIVRSVLKLAGTVMSATAAGTFTASAYTASVQASATAATAVPLLGFAVPLLGFSAILGYKTFTGFRDMWAYGKDNFFQLSVRSSVHDIARCVLNALRECELISYRAKEDDIVITERTDGTVRVYLNGSNADSALFSVSLSQVFAPIEDQRYAIQRFEVFVPKGGFEKFIYLFRYGIDKYSPMLSAYHPLPEVFSVREKALVFRKYWNKYVSPGDMVFLKGERGREVIEKYGRINSLGARRMDMKIWK